MADHWMLITIEGRYIVSEITPYTFQVGTNIKDYIKKRYPDIQLILRNFNKRDQLNNQYGELVSNLLRDGWEPFASTPQMYPGERLMCLRKRVEQKFMSRNGELQTWIKEKI